METSCRWYVCNTKINYFCINNNQFSSFWPFITYCLFIKRARNLCCFFIIKCFVFHQIQKIVVLVLIVVVVIVVAVVVSDISGSSTSSNESGWNYICSL